MARLWLLALALLGCDASTHTLYVDLKTDLVPGVELARVRTTFMHRDRSADVIEVAVARGDDLIAGRRVARVDLAPGTQRLAVTLLDPRGGTLATREVTLDLREDRGVTVVVSRACREVTCGDGLTCQGGACVDPACDLDTGAGCPPPSCRDTADCPEPVACAARVCALGECLFGGIDRRCAEGEYCDPDVGCRPEPGAPAVGGDAGAPDAGPPPPPELLAYYPCEDDATTDASGNGRDGSCTTCPVVGPSARGSACTLAGGAHVRVPSDPQIEALDAFTISFWFDATGARGTLFEKTIDGTTPAIRISVDGSVSLTWGTLSGSVVNGGFTRVSGWTHVALRWDGRVTRLHVDGVEEVLTSSGPPQMSGGDVVLGAGLDGSVASDPYPGAIDEVRIHSRSLGDAELEALRAM